MALSVQDILLEDPNQQDGLRTPEAVFQLDSANANERTTHALQAFGTYTPFIICSLIVFVLASNLGLKFSIALRRTPIPHQSPANVRRRRNMMTGYAILVVLMSFVSFMTGLTGKFTAVYMKVLLFGTAFTAANEFLERSLGIVSLAAHRTTHGKSAIRVMKGQPLNLILIRVAAAVVATGSVILKINMFSWIVLASLTFALTVFAHLSARFGVILNALYIFALILSQWTVFTDAPVKLSIQVLQWLMKLDKVTPQTDYYFLWIFPGLMLALPGYILAYLLTFDYQQHLERNPHDADLYGSLKSVSASASFGSIMDKVGTGVALPRKTPREFRKAYFKTALGAWLVSQAVMLVVFVASKGGRDDSVPVVHYMFNFMPLGIQAICLAVGIRAYVRREVREVFNYKEVWSHEPVPLPAIMVTMPEDEVDEGKYKDTLIEV